MGLAVVRLGQSSAAESPILGNMRLRVTNRVTWPVHDEWGNESNFFPPVRSLKTRRGTSGTSGNSALALAKWLRSQ